MPSQRSSRQHGVVLVITLLAILLIAAILAYVVNLGQQTSGRIVTQHSADTTAMSGAGWVARSLNTVAMNNVAMSRQITLAASLDALPQAVEFTLLDQAALCDALTEQQSRGLPQLWYAGNSGQRLIDYFNRFEQVAQQQRQNLIPLNDLLNHSTFDIHQTTYYDGPNGRGHLWRAMQALDEFNRVTVEHIPDLAQLNAIEGGRANLHAPPDAPASASGAVLLPLAPTIPIVRGRFDDFERPVRQGLLPQSVDDRVTNRGPFDAVFGWRDYRGGQVHGHWVGGGSGPVWGGGDHGGIPIGTPGNSTGDPIGNPNFVVDYVDPPTYYVVYGPQEWLMREIVRDIHGILLTHRLPGRIRQITDAKLNFLWPPPPPPAANPGNPPIPLQPRVHRPQWITNLTEAAAFAETNRPRVVSTMFVTSQIKSRFAPGSAGFMTPGSWAFVAPNPEIRSFNVRSMNGWVDPRPWPVSTPVDFIWEDLWTYEAGWDVQIGLSPQYDIDGNLIMQTVYRADHFMFAGIDVGQAEDVGNPFNMASRDGLPAPTDLDHNQLSHDAAGRQRLTFLGVARRTDHAALWPTRFRGNKPYPYAVAMAQATVFNDHSWDLWTQMWHAQLSPVRDLNGWIDRLSDADPPITAPPTDELADLQTYLRSVEPLAQVMLHH